MPGPITIKIKLDGEEIASPPVVSVNILNEMGRIPSAVIVFTDGNPAKQTFEMSSLAGASPGKDISISMGFNLNPDEIFSGVIVKHSLKVRGGSSVMVLECRHKAIKMTLGKATKVTEETKSDVTEDSILKEIFSAYTINVSASGTFLKHKGFLQYNVSDWDFIMMRAEVNAKIVYYSTKDSAFKITDPPASPSSSKTLTYGIDIFEIETEIDGRTPLSSVDAKAWDPDAQALAASSAVTDAPFKQLENTGIKASDLTSAFSPAKYTLYHGGWVSKAELDSWSKARQMKAGMAKTKGRIKISGTADINPGDAVTLAGLGDKFKGAVLITGVKHELDETGWFTQLQFGMSGEWFAEKFDISTRGAAGVTAPMHGLHVGKVLKRDEDPAGQYRIQVKLPVIDPDAKIWARMLVGDAGSNRGNVFWPEVDDEVLVGFLNDDPRYPVILGALYNKNTAPAIPPDKDNKVKGIVTKTGIKILFNDDDGKQTLQLTTPGGNSIMIDDSAKSIQLKDQNSNEITTDSNGITLKSAGEVKIDATKNLTLSSSGGDVAISGTNIKNQANAKFSANANAGAEIQTSAIAVLKGSLVQIN